MVFRWKDFHSPQVLELLKNQECLWNPKCTNYRNKNKRIKALREIHQALRIPNLTVQDIKLKIKTIRTRYAAELRKIIQSKNSGHPADELYVPKLFWYKQADSFLRGVCVPHQYKNDAEFRKSISTMVNQCDDAFEIYDEDMINAELNSHLNVERVYNETDDLLKETEDELTKQDGTYQSNLQKTNGKSKTLFDDKIQSVESAIKKLQKIAEDWKPLDEFDHFCKSIAVQLRNMPIDRALSCQQKLLQVMAEERLHHFKTIQSAAILPI